MPFKRIEPTEPVEVERLMSRFALAPRWQAVVQERQAGTFVVTTRANHVVTPLFQYGDAVCFSRA